MRTNNSTFVNSSLKPKILFGNFVKLINGIKKSGLTLLVVLYCLEPRC